MKVPYNTEAIHFISEDNIISLDRGVYYFPGCEGIISADIFIDSESIQFRIDGGNLTILPLNTPVIECVATDYFQLVVYQDSGGNLNTYYSSPFICSFAMEIIE